VSEWITLKDPFLKPEAAMGLASAGRRKKVRMEKPELQVQWPHASELT
jgi:hypothetical protein